MFNKKRTTQTSRLCTRKKRSWASLNHFLPDLLFETSACRSHFSHHTPLRPVLFHVLARQVQGHVAAQCHPRKLPMLKKETSSPDQSCPVTSRARLSTLCSYTSKEDVHSHSVQSPTLPFRGGFLGPPFLPTLEYNPETRRWPLRRSCANRSKAQAFNVSAKNAGPQIPPPSCEQNGSFLMGKKRSSPCGACFFGTFQTLAVVRTPHNIPRIQTRPRPCPARPFPHLLQTTCTNCTGRHPRGQSSDK